ncbi:type I 3-dehydroquinate dehydratase [bacterium]|nr:type I 3-dehydroquinate dehydratase [bacterium]
MITGQVCLTLTASTLEEDSLLAKKYAPYVDLFELRADYLNEEEYEHISDFPSFCPKPCILTIRREEDGGRFAGDEFDRVMLLAQLADFDYVDLEADLEVKSLLKLADMAETRIIRSAHYFEPTSADVILRMDEMARSPYEIPKVAFMPENAGEMRKLFELAKTLPPKDRIICAMGNVGFPSRVLADRLGSFLTFTSPKELIGHTGSIGHIDPETLLDVYDFKNINSDTALCGVTGWPLNVTSSPEVHRSFYQVENRNAVMLPVPAEKIEEALGFAEMLKFKGLAVTIPHKEALLNYLDEADEAVKTIGAANTVVFKDGKRIGYNTDWIGFTKALKHFLKTDSVQGKRVAVLGSGGAAKAIAYALHKEKANATIFARNIAKAKAIADKYGFSCATLSEFTSDCKPDIIVQCTSVGLQGQSATENDPIPQHEFTGKEALYDIIYKPETTPIMARANNKGCLTANGLSMLIEQAREQNRLFFT